VNFAELCGEPDRDQVSLEIHTRFLDLVRTVAESEVLYGARLNLLYPVDDAAWALHWLVLAPAHSKESTREFH